jgi:hypothetical protein
MKQKIILAAEFSRTNTYAYADSFKRVFEALGYEVVPFDTRALHNDWLGRTSSYQLRRPERWWFDRTINNKLFTLVKEIDPALCFIMKGDNIWPETIEQIRSATSCKTIAFYPDNPFVFWNGNSSPHVVQMLQAVDRVLIWSLELKTILESIGCRSVQYFPFAYDKDYFDKVALVDGGDEKQFDLIFIGTADDERIDLIEGLVKALPNLSYGIWGNRWREMIAGKDLALEKYYYGPAVYGEALARLMQQSKLVLNVLRCQNLHAHNMRTLEVPALGGFQVATRSLDHGTVILREDETIVCFDGLEELVSKVRTWIFRDEERQRMSDQAYKTIQSWTLQRWLRDVVPMDHSQQPTIVLKSANNIKHPGL